MAKRNIVVIGASAGGFEVLKQIIGALPADLNASIFIVWHMSPYVRGILPDVFNKLNTLQAAHAEDNEPIMPNRIYVAPPDHHLLIEEGNVRVTRGPKENRFRPAVDPLFRSAAHTYRNRVIGVILSGALDDGTAGLWRIKENGGLTVVQHPDDAEIPSMPENALREVKIDYCLPAADLATLLTDLTSEDVNDNSPDMKDEKTKIEIGIAAEDNAFNAGSLDIGTLSPYTCPECHGVLSKILDGTMVRYRCHTGHAYSSDSLLLTLSENVEASIYKAIRGMDETILLLNHIGDHHAEINMPTLAALYFKKAIDIKKRSELLRTAVHDHEQLSKDQLSDEIKEHP